jgi:hypothetical protein
MRPWTLSTPVVFTIFNRPDLTLKVFNAIRRVQPPSLLIVADGPRRGRVGEERLCAETRDVVSCVDWDCDVQRNYSDVNLGCRARMSSGLTWAFGLSPEVIVLEDDCLPSLTFFRFCEELLERHRFDTRVQMISGYNFEDRTLSSASYFFSKYPHVWGWASWRRAWNNYDVQLRSWPAARRVGELEHQFADLDERRFWTRTLDAVRRGQIDTWDAQLVYLAFKSRALTAVPRVSLIENLGFGLRATHTKLRSSFADTTHHEMDFPLVHPDGLVRNGEWDERRRRAEYRSHGPLGRGLQILGGVARSIRERF